MTNFANDVAAEFDAMWRFALRLTANKADAEDLVQRTCVKALESVDKYQQRGKLRSWLFRIEHRIWLNVLRSRSIRNAGSFKQPALSDSVTHDSNELPSATVQAHTAETDDSPETVLRLHEIYQQVEALPDAQRVVVILVCVEGFTYQETADVLDIAIGTVMSRLARARISLGKSMQSIGASTLDKPKPHSTAARGRMNKATKVGKSLSMVEFEDGGLRT